MRKLIILLILFSFSILSADFIIPPNDPVYEFLEMTNTLRRSSLNHFQYPLYYNRVMEELESITNDRTSTLYRNIALYHQQRLNMNYQQGTQVAVWPPRRFGESFTGLFRWDPTQQRFLTITDPDIRQSQSETSSSSTFRDYRNRPIQVVETPQNETFLYISGLLGYQYDNKIMNNEDVNRTRRYWGVESAGNFAPNFGYYFLFRKGHYYGDDEFISENPFITKMGDGIWKDGNRYYQVDLISEIDFKNRFLNLSLGYGSFDIGRSISSSIILNSEVTPYGYFKFNKKFGIIEYNGIAAQLIPSSTIAEGSFEPKGMGIQTVSMHTSNFSLGLGNSIIYSDRSLDLAYSTPLAVYKIIDNKYHGKDNGLFYGFGEVRPINGLNIYANFLFDDINKERFTTDKWMSYAAYQGGMLAQMSNMPLEIGGEITAVGPSTYGHKTGNLNYMQDNMMLGHREGSNFLSFAGRIRFHFTRTSFFFYYENVQQGDIAFDPTPEGYEFYEQKFLSNNISRRELFRTHFDLRLIPELHIFARYDYKKLPDNEMHYIFTGAEFKY
ncbi:MAG: hypothetical protein FWG98_13160 [Candidatus Cloacimonetes bacterium]|nr:hypothetical protein [Candidatus Cloacimonadota bacterium]